MSDIDQNKQLKRDALKNLRNERKQWITAAAKKLKARKKDITAIKTALKKDIGTVPMIARETGIPAASVLWYIATLKKYGQVIEGEKDGSYFQYVLVGRTELASEEQSL